MKRKVNEMDQSRWKSPVLWTAILSLIALVAKNWIGFQIPGWDEITTGILAVLAAFGVINNPTSKTNM